MLSRGRTMKRLTLKLEDPIDTKYLHYEYKRIPDYDIDHGNTGRITDADIYNKLGKLEDIEEEIGVDLVTLIKVLIDGVHIQDEKIHDVMLGKYEEEDEYFLYTKDSIGIRYMIGYIKELKEELE